MAKAPFKKRRSGRLSEADFQRKVIELATAHGWACYSVRNSKAGVVSLAGYPDVHLFRPSLNGRYKPGSFWLELKTSVGKLSEKQKVCIEGMQDAGLEVHVMRPKDIPWLIGRLKGLKE